MHQPDTSHFSREDVDKLLASGLRRISFPRPIEVRYEADRHDSRRKHLLIYGAISLLLFDLFIFYDIFLVPDIATTGALLRFGFVTPLAIASFLALYAMPNPIVREMSSAAAGLAAFATIVYLSAASASPLAAYHHFGAVLVLVFANVVQRLDFHYALAASAAAILLYIPAVIGIEALPREAAFAAIMMMAAGLALTLFANHSMDRQLRLAYLFHLRDGMRHVELDALAQIDPLTGLGNRRQLDRHLGNLWSMPADEARPACVLVLDVDFFKKYNDRYGHPAGDLCLKRIAAIVTGELRNTGDAAFRFGGEEFVVVLKNSELMDGVRTGERIRHAVQVAGIPHEDGGAQRVVTVSIGAAASIPAGAISKDEIIMSADTALYAAKRAGRNQVWPPLSGKGARVTYLSEVRGQAAS